MIAALYVETNGVYYGLPDVDPWDEARDARLYAGPWPVVAHPPCARWSVLAPLVESIHGYRVGDDGGCFASAYLAVRTFGGVLEHPAGSLAWDHFRLPRPVPGGWSSAFGDPGYATEVAQGAYGLPARKRTWLYAVGVELPALDWREPLASVSVSAFGSTRGKPKPERYNDLGKGHRAHTPLAFRDALLDMARSALTPTPESV
jgi:hypothetical protein